ncbi:class I SAM-dependent RNA methyltransferase [Corynebacterium sp. 4HC-13]|uniref:class I SAM-dependent RNA methyltransferase n=1 Tax=Corynebacterium anserum TaxID=2684406 RepID=UPI00163A4FAF|nr:class I SAM-dependent RNA methyltransferase [Corynebacterium anserum]MBC2681678.1 class I SAM-dependent RNA methyltransferase [Corynebacterium anserum]
MARSPRPEMITMNLDNPAHGGTVIGRIDGQVVFVSGGLPGETGVRVELAPQKTSSSRKGFRTGRVISVEKPSPYRIPARCAAAAAGGGCCDLDFVDGVGSLEYKKAVVVDQLRRIGKIVIEGNIPCDGVSLSPQVGWRTRVRLGVDKTGRAGVRRKASREVIPLEQAQCAQWAQGLVAGLENERFTPGSEIAVALGDSGERSVVELTGNRRHRHSRVVGGHETVAHRLTRVPEVEWQIEPQGFWQGHRAAPDFYTQWIGEVIPAGHGSAWDLYGGAGVFSSVLSGRVDWVDCVDHASQASMEGARALAAAGLDNVRFVDGDVAHSLDRLRVRTGLHAVVIDPPRVGAGIDVIARVAAYEPNHVVHIGCDPATAARDLGAWISAGYQLEKLTVVDAFPLTHHVEILAYLTPAASS